MTKKSTGNPVPEVQSNFDRSGGSRALAYAHQSLRQASADMTGPIVTTNSNELSFVGAAAFRNANSGTDTPQGPNVDHGQPRVQVVDYAEQAGRYSAMHETAGFDYGNDHLTGTYESAPTGAVSNGSHDSSSQQAAVTTPRPAMKNSDRLDIMKRFMRGEL